MIDYRAMLAESADPEFARFHSGLMPGKKGVLGVKVPIIRKIARKIIDDDWRGYLSDVPGCYEEEMLRALVIATAPMDTSERISLTADFLPSIDNWAVSDTFCSSWKFPGSDSEKVWDYFAGLMGSDDEFSMRVSLIARMDHFKDRSSTERLLEDIQAYDNPGYYYRMGAAWAVSVCYVRFPEPTVEALGSGRLCGWTQNKSVQKIRESLRVSAEEKKDLERFRVPL